MMHLASSSPRLKARVAGAFYAISAVTGSYGVFAGHGQPLGHVAILVGGATYLVVTVLLYSLLKPVDKELSLLAALFSVAGVAASAEDGFFFFGCYCLLIGILIFRSTFFPRAVGVLMALAGVGLLTNTVALMLSSAFAHSLSPIPTVLDALGELSLTLWLLVFGVNAQRWDEQARR
jgi:hypothetical protein